MEFEKKVPEWEAQGTEPPSSLKTTGFQSGYKPPAAYFNWFWHCVSACLKEIREKLSGHAADKTNPHGVTAAQVGLDKVNNTPDSEKAVNFAQEAGVARKAQSALTVRFNGGKTEGTDQWTYDGSTGRSVNITAPKIGAAANDLSNVDGASFRAKASSAGANRIPTVAATSADGVAYAATVEGVTELYNGMLITIIPEIASTSTAVTLNVNGTGAKILRLPLSFNNAAMTAPTNANFFTAGRPITVQYDANYTTGGAWKTIGKQKTSAQDLYGTVPIEGGGTGATTAAEARASLGITPANIGAVAMKTATASLSASGWSSKTQTVSVSGVTANNVVIVTPAPGSHTEYNGCAVRCTAQASGKLTFTCTNVPTSALTANVLILT